MKKIKIIVGAILRGALVIAPCIVSGWWFWSKAPALIAILAALGVEFIAGVIITFATIVAAQYKAQSEIKKEQAEESRA